MRKNSIGIVDSTKSGGERRAGGKVGVISDEPSPVVQVGETDVVINDDYRGIFATQGQHFFVTEIVVVRFSFGCMRRIVLVHDSDFSLCCHRYLCESIIIIIIYQSVSSLVRREKYATYATVKTGLTIALIARKII